MTVFARFKYQRDRPALRVHIWDIFDYANLNTSSIPDLFQSIHEQLCEIYEEQNFDKDVIELSAEHLSDSDNSHSSEDSANEMLVNDLYKITKYNVFDEDADEDADEDRSLEEPTSQEPPHINKSVSGYDVIIGENIQNSAEEFDLDDLNAFMQSKQASDQKERLKRLESVLTKGKTGDKRGGLFLPNPDGSQQIDIFSLLRKAKKSDRSGGA